MNQILPLFQVAAEWEESKWL